MHDLFFGQMAVVGWFIVAALMLFCAVYTWYIVLEVGGVRGTALAITWTSCAIICSANGLALSEQQLIPPFVLGAIIAAAWPPIVISALVLTDIYAADRNNHRSFTARSYFWYKRVTHHDGEARGGHTPIVLGR